MRKERVIQKSRKIINSTEYGQLLKELQKKIKLRILSDYSDNAANRDDKKLNVADMSEDDVLDIINNDKKYFQYFILEKIRAHEDVGAEEEYPKGEEVEEEDANELTLGYARGFVLLYAVEYYLLKNNPIFLEKYLKETRVPQAKKYARELDIIFKKIHNSKK